MSNMKYKKGDKVAKLSDLSKELTVEATYTKKEQPMKITKYGMYGITAFSEEEVDKSKKPVDVDYYSLSDNTSVKGSDLTLYFDGIGQLAQDLKDTRDELQTLKNKLGNIGDRDRCDDEE